MKNRPKVLLFLALLICFTLPQVVSEAYARDVKIKSEEIVLNVKNPSYYIYFSKGSDSATGEMKKIKAEYGQTVTLPKCEFNNVGYTFVEWVATCIDSSQGEDNKIVYNVSYDDGEIILNGSPFHNGTTSDPNNFSLSNFKDGTSINLVAIWGVPSQSGDSQGTGNNGISVLLNNDSSYTCAKTEDTNNLYLDFSGNTTIPTIINIQTDKLANYAIDTTNINGNPQGFIWDSSTNVLTIDKSFLVGATSLSLSFDSSSQSQNSGDT